jgi:hypothetical protein
MVRAPPPFKGGALAQLRADALGLLAEQALAAGFGEGAPVSGSRAERYQVVLHVERATLREDDEVSDGVVSWGAESETMASRGVAIHCDRSTHPSRGPLSDLGSRILACAVMVSGVTSLGATIGTAVVLFGAL